MKDAITELYKISGEMVRGLDQPSEYIEDWTLPKSTPITAKREIENQCIKAHEKRVDWAIRIRQAINLIDSHNKSIN